MKRSLRTWFPIFLFLPMVIALGYVLTQPKTEQTAHVKSKPLPEFHLPSLQDGQYYTKKDLKGEWSLVNIWASWCTPCKAEHDVLVNIAKQSDIPIYGFNFKDDENDAKAWLAERGNPYDLTLSDSMGRMAFDLGAYGVPETFLLNKNGEIVYQYVGILTDEIWKERFVPIMNEGS